MQQVLDFIEIFRSPSNEILFKECACYWFSLILHNRFSNSRIVYNPQDVHFATKIDTTVYDISGVVKYPEDYVDWETYKLTSEDSYEITEYCIKLKGGELR